MPKVIEDDNFLNDQEKKYLEKEIINGEYFPFYWNKDQTVNDGLPYFGHILKHRDAFQKINSPYYYFFYEILKRFCKKHKLKIKQVLRGAVNLTTPLDIKTGIIHRDHQIKHKQFILYLTDSKKGYTYLYNNKHKLIKKIKAKKYKIACFDDQLHSVGYPSHKEKRRLVVILTFN